MWKREDSGKQRPDECIKQKRQQCEGAGHDWFDGVQCTLSLTPHREIAVARLSFLSLSGKAKGFDPNLSCVK